MPNCTKRLYLLVDLLRNKHSLGADISDYFNYGFTEDTWKQYCEKQRRMRMESARGPYVSMVVVHLIVRFITVVSFLLLKVFCPVLNLEISF